LKPVAWIASSLKDLRAFPEELRDDVGFSLYQAQLGRKPADAKPLRGFGSANVLEIVASGDDRTYRAVFTVQFADIIYVLHCFEKKSRSGIATPRQEIDLIKARLKLAEQEYKTWKESK